MTLVAVALAAVTLLVSVALVITAGSAESAARDRSGEIRSVRTLQSAESSLLLHQVVDDPETRRDAERDLLAGLDEADRLARTASEREALREVRAAVDRYLASADGGATSVAGWSVAHQALEEIIDLNVDEADAARDRAEQWNWNAWVVAGAGAVLPIALATGLLWWLYGRAFRPTVLLDRAMDQFARGERDARAEELGPREIRDLARRFNQMAAAIVNQRESQIAFVGGVAHDLRTPLNALRLSAAAIRPDRPLPAESRIRALARRVDAQVTRLDRMIGDLLDSARIEAGQLELVLEARDARELVRALPCVLGAASPDHRIAVTMPDEEVWIRCDPLRVDQVLTNLVTNAIKYSPEGGIVEVTLRRGEGEAVITVTDSGVGMTAEEQRLLFDAFRRLPTTRNAVPGTGLGLYVVRRIVEAHGGRVEVASERGRGSSFTVRLPSAPVGASAPAAKA